MSPSTTRLSREGRDTLWLLANAALASTLAVRSAPALADDERALNYAELDALMDRIAAALQRDGIAPGECIATCAAPSATSRPPASWRR